MEFHGTPWNFYGETWKFHGIPWNSRVWKNFHGIPWNFGSEQNSMEFHGIPWNLRFCCTSSMEFNGTTGVVQMLFKKFHGTLEKVPWSIEKRFWTIFWYIMSNAGNAYCIMQILIIKHQLAKETSKIYRVFINFRKLIHPAQLNIIFIKILKLKFHRIPTLF